MLSSEPMEKELSFPNLPLEIRDAIWKCYAESNVDCYPLLAVSPVISKTPGCCHRKPRHRVHRFRILTSVSPLLSISSETRERYRQRHRLLFDDPASKNAYVSNEETALVYIPSVDQTSCSRKLPPVANGESGFLELAMISLLICGITHFAFASGLRFHTMFDKE